MKPLWQVAGVSVRGAGHVRGGDPCQDACAFEELDNGFLVLAVADGAGSARLAREAAQLQVETATDFLTRRLAGPGGARADPRELLEPALCHALAEVEAAAAAANTAPRDMAATMILAVAAPTWVCCAQIGDGAVVRATGEDAFAGLTVPSGGEYVNETTFLVSPGALDQVQYASCGEAVPFLALLSDGLQRLALVLPGGQPHAPFFQRMRKFVGQVPDFEQRQAELASFLGSTHVQSRADDDLTLVLAARALP
jgi:hypothetical protein